VFRLGGSQHVGFAWAKVGTGFEVSGRHSGSRASHTGRRWAYIRKNALQDAKAQRDYERRRETEAVLGGKERVSISS
jgi:hypothetical protein